MNRRNFIKTATAGTALATWTVTCKFEEEEHDPKGHEGETGEVGYNWDYRVYCYERGQGEWVFSTNVTGSFAHQREYMTLEDEKESSYYGFMDGGKLHFANLEEAQSFIEHHYQQKDNDNIIDTIYDIYYVSRELDEKEDGGGEHKETEIQVAHHWYNQDGKQIQWQTKPPYSDVSKIERS